MYVNQLAEINTEAAPSCQKARWFCHNFLVSCHNTLPCPRSTIKSAVNTNAQIIRAAKISLLGTCVSIFQNSGNDPQNKYANSANRIPFFISLISVPPKQKAPADKNPQKLLYLIYDLIFHIVAVILQFVYVRPHAHALYRLECALFLRCRS